MSGIRKDTMFPCVQHNRGRPRRAETQNVIQNPLHDVKEQQAVSYKP